MCMLDEDSTLVQQVMSVFDYEAILKKKEELAESRDTSVENVKIELDSARGREANLIDTVGMRETLEFQHRFGVNSYYSEYLNGHKTVIEFMISKKPSGFFFPVEFGSGNYKYDCRVPQIVVSNDGKTLIFEDLEENGNLVFNQLGMGIGLKLQLFESSSRSFSLDFSAAYMGGLINWGETNYYWSHGSKDVRGRIDGVEDELINIPELGFQEDVSVIGERGQLNIDSKSFYRNYNLKLEAGFRKVFFSIGFDRFNAKVNSLASKQDLLYNESIGLAGNFQNIDLRQRCLELGIGVKF
jgi:hypothetical protein